MIPAELGKISLQLDFDFPNNQLSVYSMDQEASSANAFVAGTPLHTIEFSELTEASKEPIPTPAP